MVLSPMFSLSGFLGHEMVDLLIEKGEVRTRDAAKQLGRRLMQAGIIHHVMNEQDFRDEVRLYRFKVDEPESQGRSDYSAPNTMASLVSRAQSMYTHNANGSESGSDRTSEFGVGALRLFGCLVVAAGCGERGRVLRLRT